VEKILIAFEEGGARAEDVELLSKHCKWLGPGNTFCALAPGAVEPLQSALKYFPEEFERHAAAGRCPYREAA
jgi:NADH-quinone oxidoreductase subunit F